VARTHPRDQRGCRAQDLDLALDARAALARRARETGRDLDGERLVWSIDTDRDQSPEGRVAELLALAELVSRERQVIVVDRAGDRGLRGLRAPRDRPPA
jgi:hypothetical protein